MQQHKERSMATCKLFPAFFFLLYISQQGATVAAEECTKKSIEVSQARTGRTVEGRPEYEVTVANNCGCQQSEVEILCNGLSSVEPVDPRAIRPVDDKKCVIDGGRPLLQGSPVKFTYAWLNPHDFPVVTSTVSC